MRTSARGLDQGFVYPTSRVDVVEAFGKGLVSSVDFGFYPDFFIRSNEPHKPKISGRVIMELSVSQVVGPSLSIFRVRSETCSDYLRFLLREMMRGPMKDWLLARLDQPETHQFGYECLLVEMVEGSLKLHKWKPK